MDCTPSEGFDLGTTVRLAAKLKDDGQPVDAQFVVLNLKSPTGIASQPDVVRIGVGDFYRDIQVDEPGQWKFRWATQGPISVHEGSFVVRKSQVL